jgi:SAM-dependent methyltransferase
VTHPPPSTLHASPSKIETILARATRAACPLCGSASATPVWFRGLDSLAAVDADAAPPGAAGWWVVRCTICGLGRVDPLPQEADLPALYDEAYFTTGAFAGAPHTGGMDGHLALYDRPGGREASLRYQGRLVAQVERFWQERRGRLLDVGCGAGYFLDAARAAGWDVRGVELSPAAARVGREQLRLDIFQGTLAEAGFPDGWFDVVTLFEVVEHLRDPGAVLAEAQRIPKPGGLLAVQVPNDLAAFRSSLSRPDNRWWVIPPLHLFYFTDRALRRWLEALSMDVLSLASEGNAGNDAVTLLRARGQPLGRYLTAGLRRLSLPVDWLLARVGRHSELMAIARKQARE